MSNAVVLGGSEGKLCHNLEGLENLWGNVTPFLQGVELSVNAMPSPSNSTPNNNSKKQEHQAKNKTFY